MTTIIITNCLAFGALFASIFAITSYNTIISIILVIATFVQAAGYLILIGVNFVGVSYIVIYVGAIAVLFLFVVMMINIKSIDIMETGPQYSKNIPLAVAMGSVFTFIYVSLFPFNYHNLPTFAFLFEVLIDYNRLSSIFDGYTFDINKSIYFNIINFLVNIYTNPANADVVISGFTQIEVLGYSLYTYDAILLIILSVILLLAMVATIIISRSNK